MQRLRIHIITVIYNRRIEEIVSLRQFEKLAGQRPEVDVIIADNSTEESILEQNHLAAARRGWFRYIGCGGNIGLSRAYNLAIASLPSENPYWVMLADDDTFFSMEYLECACRQVHVEEMLRMESEQCMKSGAQAGRNMKSSVQAGQCMKAGLGGARREPLRMLCGVVLTGDTGSRFLSPRSEHAKELALYGMLRPPKPGIYRDLYPINSGLFLEGSAIREVGGFDERLFLDQVDYLMMDRLRTHGIRRIGIVPGLIRQSFSGDLRKAFTKNDHTKIDHTENDHTENDHTENDHTENDHTENDHTENDHTENDHTKNDHTKNDHTDNDRMKNDQTQPGGNRNRDRIFRKDFQTYCELTGKPWYYRAFILGRRRLMLTAKRLLG